MLMNTHTNLPALLLTRARAEPLRTILRYKHFGAWREMSGTDALTRISAISAGLAACGLVRGEAAAILASTSREWLLSDLAIMEAGGISAAFQDGIDATELARLVSLTQTRVLFVGDRVQLDVALAARDQARCLRTIICFDARAADVVSAPNVLSLAALEQHGVNAPAQPSSSASSTEGAIIITTSGMSGPARAVSFDHAAICARVQSIVAALPANASDTRLSLMSAAHPFERVTGLYHGLVTGVVLIFPESFETAFDNLREIQPTIVALPPRRWRAMAALIDASARDATGLQRNLFALGLNCAERAARNRKNGIEPSGLTKLGAALTAPLAIAPSRRRLGLSHVRLALSGGAALSQQTAEWFLIQGIELINVYTQAEAAGAVALSPQARATPGVLQNVIDALEIAVSPTGELLLRGTGVSLNYAGEPAVGNSADGWFNSGDLAVNDSDNGVRVLGALNQRAADAFMPRVAEDAFGQSAHVADSIVFGTAPGILNALIAIDYDSVVKFAQDNEVPFTHFRSLSEAQQVHALIGREVERVNTIISPAKIAGFSIIGRPLGQDGNDVGPALNVRRARLIAEFSLGASAPGDAAAPAH